MDILDELREQHVKIRNLLIEIENTVHETRRATLLETLKGEIELHLYLEETLLYPVLNCYEHLQNRVCCCWDEHTDLKRMMQEIVKGRPLGPHFNLNLRTLEDKINQHFLDEEDEIYPETRKTIPHSELESLSGKMTRHFANTQKKEKQVA